MFLGPGGLSLFGETGGKVGLPKCKHAEHRLPAATLLVGTPEMSIFSDFQN